MSSKGGIQGKVLSCLCRDTWTQWGVRCLFLLRGATCTDLKAQYCCWLLSTVSMTGSALQQSCGVRHGIKHKAPWAKTVYLLPDCIPGHGNASLCTAQPSVQGPQATKMCHCPRSWLFKPCLLITPKADFKGKAAETTASFFRASSWISLFKRWFCRTQELAAVPGWWAALQAVPHMGCQCKGAKCSAAPAMKQWYICLQGAEDTKTGRVKLEDRKKQC